MVLEALIHLSVGISSPWCLWGRKRELLGLTYRRGVASHFSLRTFLGILAEEKCGMYTLAKKLLSGFMEKY